jgi:hypothetical protein
VESCLRRIFYVVFKLFLLAIVHKVSALVTFRVRGSLVVKALDYKPGDRWFGTRWREILNVLNPSGRTRPWGLLSL